MVDKIKENKITKQIKPKDVIKNKKKLKGSGVLIVIISSITFSIYAMSVYAEEEHFTIMQNRYEKNIVSEYGKYNDNIEGFYEDTLEINNNENNVNRLNLR